MGLAPKEKEIVAWVSLDSGGIETGRRYSFMPVVIDRMVGFTVASIGNTRPVEKADSEITYLGGLKAGKHRPYISGSGLRNYRAANTEWIPLYQVRGLSGAQISVRRGDRYFRCLQAIVGALNCLKLAGQVRHHCFKCGLLVPGSRRGQVSGGWLRAPTDRDITKLLYREWSNHDLMRLLSNLSLKRTRESISTILRDNPRQYRRPAFPVVK